MTRLRTELAARGVDLPESARCVRQYVNAGDRSAGAWSWTVVPDIGSIWPMREVLTAPVWHVNGEPERHAYGFQWHVDLA
jgi:hypothetical protein